MLSNKLTFSLVLVLMLAFAATSVYAQEISADDTIDVAAITANAAGMFVVLAETTDQNGIVTLVPPVEEEAFNDLNDFLRSGGTIEVWVSAAFAGIAEADTDTVKKEKADKVKHAVIVSEIMWAHDLSQEPATRAQSQWIELYIHSTGELTVAGGGTGADDIKVLLTWNRKVDRLGMILEEGATSDAVINDFVVVDTVSAIDRFARYNALPGSNGNTDTLDDGTPPADLVSAYRKAALKDGKYEVKEGAIKDLKMGDDPGAWAASAARDNLRGYFMGTPGTYHIARVGGGADYAKSPGSVAATGVIFNEIRNDTSEANLDWIEFYHFNDAVDATAQDINNWTVSIVTATKKDDGTYEKPVDKNLFSFPKYKLQPDTYLVVYNRHPVDTILAGGVNIEDVAAGTQVNKGASHMYIVKEDLDLPTGDKFLLVLRNGNDKVNTHEKIVDYIGAGFFGKDGTDIHPLRGWAAPGDQAGFGDDLASSGAWARQTNLNAKGVYRPDSRADNRGHKDDWSGVGEMGGVGYDRDVDLNNAPGTPGYANVIPNVRFTDQDNVKAEDDYTFNGMVTISEVMYDARHPRDLVQWIELYNNSPDTPINIAGWEMEIRNIPDGKVESYVDSGFKFAANTEILPNQTLLLVSRTGPSSVPRTRVYDLNQRHRTELGLQRRDKVLLSSEGFLIELKAKISENGASKMMSVDSAGNLMVDRATRTKQWDLPAADEDGSRRSIVRQYVAGEADPGDMADSWKAFGFLIQSYYGHRDDAGSPGYRRGGPLPVSLSSFRPVRDKATGQVVITWITESELNNAGFNILRSETKTGEFQKVNVQLIAGHGTTSEKHVYTYTDKTAKPNVVYYYQIEDVSLNGNRTTLATTHMRGNVNASGKLTTTWSILKSSD